MRHSIAGAAASALLCAWLLCAALAAAAVAARDRVDWLAVQAPAAAERGRPFELRISLKRPVAGAYLHADLHGSAGGRWLGFVASAGSAPVVGGRAEYAFSIRLPESRDLSEVVGILYLSGNGSWESRIEAARLRPLPVVDPPIGSRPPLEGPPLAKAELLPLSETLRPVAPRVDSLPLRILTAAAFAAGAASALRRRLSKPLAAAFAAAFAWEAALPEEFLARSLRAAAEAGGWYLRRGRIQLAAVLAALAAGAAIAALIVARGRTGSFRESLAWLGLHSYACLALLRVVSQHDVDAFLSRAWADVQAGQAARLCFAALSLASVALLAPRDA
jgi:hypothetical protein